MVEINLLSWREPRQQFIFKLIASIYSIILGFVVLILLALHSHLAHQSSLMREKLQQLDNQQNKVVNQTTRRNDSSGEEILLSKNKKQTIIFALMRELFRLQIPGVHLIEIVFERKQLVMRGLAEDSHEIYHLMAELLALKKMSAVKLDSMKRKPEGIQFQLRVVEF